MLYEFIATISAGFAMAGIALIIRHLSKLILKKQTPKWLIPLFASVGIFFFQISQEYSWFAQMDKNLPEGVTVVKTIEATSWYRPWTYMKPQIIRFIAVDIGNTQINMNNPHLKRTNIYLFERRMSSQVIPQIFNCNTAQQADLPANSAVDDNNLQWIDMDKQENLYQVVCK